MSVEHNKNERRRILELSSPQSSGRTKMKVQLTPLGKIRSKLTSKLNKSTFYIDAVNVEKYSIREVKKSGKPNYDLPIFNYSTTLQNCKENKFALTWDDQAQSHIIYEQKNEMINVKPHHKKKDMKELTIKKYRINREDSNVDKDRLCIIY